MLSAAEADLVRRDSKIPGLATVLEPDAFVAGVREAAPDADLRGARITYLRYKPRKYCRVTYRLDVGGLDVELDVRACRPEDLASWLADGDGATGAMGPLGRRRLVLKDCAVVANVFPNDLRLPQVRQLADPAERELVLRDLLPDRPDLWRGELHGLSYRPERRYVAEVRGADRSRVILKCYTPRAYKRAKRHATSLRSQGPLRVARLLGFSDDRRLLAFEWLSGQRLMQLLAGPTIDMEGVRAAGSALAALHSQKAGELECWSPQDEAGYLAGLAAEVGFTCPSLAQRADALARRLGADLAAAPALHFPVHGDFSGDQVLVDGDTAGIIDLDSAYCGDRADDPGKFVAQAEHLAAQGKLGAGQVTGLRDALLEGYARTTRGVIPERIELYMAAALLRRTRFPFRTREPNWPDRTAVLLELAEETYAKATRGL